MLGKIFIVLGMVAWLVFGIAAWYAMYPSQRWFLQLAEARTESSVQLALAELQARVSSACSIGCTVTSLADGRIEVRTPALWVSEYSEELLTVPGHFSMRLVQPVREPSQESNASGLLRGDQASYFRATSEVLVTNEDVDDAYVSQDQSEGYVIRALLGARGATALSKAIAGRQGQQLGLIMDGRVVAAPIVNGALGKHIQWTMERGTRSREQQLRELGLVARLMKAPPMTHRLRIARSEE